MKKNILRVVAALMLALVQGPVMLGISGEVPEFSKIPVNRLKIRQFLLYLQSVLGGIRPETDCKYLYYN